jgi:hypothetical protein
MLIRRKLDKCRLLLFTLKFRKSQSQAVKVFLFLITVVLHAVYRVNKTKYK